MGGSVQEFRVDGPGDGRELAGPSVLVPLGGARAAGLAIPGQRQMPPSPPVGLPAGMVRAVLGSRAR